MKPVSAFAAAGLLTLSTSAFAQDPATPQEKVDAESAIPIEAEVAKEKARIVKRMPKGKGKSNAWFEETDQDLGTYFGEEDASGTFRFKNPTDAQQKFTSFKPSCVCAKAVFRIGDREYTLTKNLDRSQDNRTHLLHRINKRLGGDDRELVEAITLEAGEAGEIEVHMEMAKVQGPRQASLDIYTTDEKTPMTQLQWTAVGATMFSVMPTNINLNEMAWNETRDFVYEITSPLLEDFEITGIRGKPAHTEVKYEKTMRGNLSVWRVSGTFGPVEDEKNAGGEIVLTTNAENGAVVKQNIHAFVRGPIDMDPGFLSLGIVRKDEGKKMTARIKSNADFAVRSEGITLAKLSFPEEFVQVTTREDGNDLIVELEIKPGMSKRQVVRGDIVVKLNHPLVKERKVLFNGYVR